MNKIYLHLHSDADGILALNIPVELQNTEFLITIEPVSNEPSSSSDFFESMGRSAPLRGSSREDRNESLDTNEEEIYDDLDEFLSNNSY